MKYFLFTFFTFFVINICNAQNELIYNLDSVVVSANRVPMTFSDIGRNVNVITEHQAARLPVLNFQDLLGDISGIDVKKRGPEGVQADISIRGGNFEQSLILIDGIPLSDPQTGHHNMNLPISFNQIERVEILKGQGTEVYGANAFSGAINFITKKNGKNNLNVELEGGENNFYKLGVSTFLNLGNSFNSISFSKIKSDGYRFNTGFDNYKFSMNNSFKFSDVILNTIYGYVDKDFGANSFYTIQFPNQAEKTKTHFASVYADINISRFNILPKISWRRNSDEFVLDKDNPNFYKNNHLTNVYNGTLQTSTNIFGGTTSVGFEYSHDKINSNNLGVHERSKKGIFAEQTSNLFGKFHLSFGGYVYNYSNFGWKFWPAFDAAFSISKNSKIYINFGKAFRIPTYTELYYSDPVTVGNKNLQPEESTNYEIGYKLDAKNFEINSSIFRKEGKNLIDWSYNENDKIWKANNITKINTTGFDLAISLYLSNNYYNGIIDQLMIDYTYLNSDKIQTKTQSRYVLDFLRHDLSFTLINELPFKINLSWVFKYEDRITLKDHFIINSKIQRDFKKFKLYLNISNLLNKSYEEIPSVPLPGRWIIGGIKFNVL